VQNPSPPLPWLHRLAEKEKLFTRMNTIKEPENEAGTGEDKRGDIIIQGFGAQGANCILDVQVTDTDAKSHSKQLPANVLETHKKEKKRKYIGACLERRRHFTPFVCSLDGLLGQEATIFSKCLAVKLSAKWQRTYS
jgi:hypothetical protein